MLMQTKRKHVPKNNYLKNEELIANQYALKSANTVFIVSTIVWILNLLNVSVGYACGEGKDLDTIIHNADQMMYENKRLLHKENECKELNKQK